MNSLLNFSGLPPFTQIKPADVEPAIRQLIDEHRATLEKVLAQPTPTWSNTVAVLEQMQHRLSRSWSPVGHLNSVMNNDELRAAYNACLPLLSAWHTDLGQNEKLFHSFETIQQHEAAKLDEAQQHVLKYSIRYFKMDSVVFAHDKI